MTNASLHLDAILTELEREYQTAVPCTQGHLCSFPERRNKNESRRQHQHLTLQLPIMSAQDSAHDAHDGTSLSLKTTFMFQGTTCKNTVSRRANLAL